MFINFTILAFGGLHANVIGFADSGAAADRLSDLMEEDLKSRHQLSNVDLSKNSVDVSSILKVLYQTKFTLLMFSDNNMCPSPVSELSKVYPL